MSWQHGTCGFAPFWGDGVVVPVKLAEQLVTLLLEEGNAYARYL